MSHTHWRRYLQDAARENDANELVNKVSEAKMAIILRYRELTETGDSQEERQALRKAVRVLRSIEVKRLGFPMIKDEFGNPVY